MLRIPENYPYELEILVRKVYGCERFGLARLADADYLGKNPYHAALLIFAPKLYELEKVHTEESVQPIIDLLEKYEVFLDNKVEIFNKELVDEYVKDLRKLIKDYYHFLSLEK